MTTIKNCTDLQQSKKLINILPIESADNVIVSIGHNDGAKTVIMPRETLDIIKTPFSDIRKTTPCWSLAALLDVLPDGTDVTKDKSDTENEKYMCTVLVNDSLVTTFANNPVDVCYKLILRLHNINLL